METVISPSDKELQDAGYQAPPKLEHIDEPALQEWEEVGEDGKPKLKAGIVLGTDGKPVTNAPDAVVLQEWEEMGEDNKPKLKAGIVLGTDGKPVPNAADDELSDEAVLKFLKKRNPKINSLDDIKPAAEEEISPEEKAKKQEKRTQDAVQFAFQNNIFSKKEYDSFITFQNTPKLDVVKENFIAGLKAADADLSDTDAEERFKEVFHQYEDEDSWKYKFGMSEIDRQYDQILNTKFNKIVGVEDVFDQVNKNLTNAKAFRTKIDDIFTNKIEPTLEFEILGEKVKATLFDKALSDTVKGNYLTAEMMNSLLADDGSIDEAALILEIKKDYVFNNLNAIVAEAAKSLAEIEVKKNKKARIAANFNEDLVIDEVEPGAGKAKSSSDKELEEAKRTGVI